MPTITGIMNDINASLSGNQLKVKEWGDEVGKTMRGLKTISKEIYDFAQTEPGIALWTILKSYAFGVPLSMNYGVQAMDPGKRTKPGSREQIEGRSTGQSFTNPPAPDSKINDAETRAAEAKKAAEKEAQARIKLNQANIAEIQGFYKELQDITTENFRKRYITAEKFRAETRENEQQLSNRHKQIVEEDFNTRIKSEENATEKQVLAVQKRTALDAIERDSKGRIREANKLIADEEIKQSQEKVKAKQSEIAAELALANAQNKRTVAEREASGATLADLVKVKQGLEAIFEPATSLSTKGNVFKVFEEGVTKNIELIGGYLLRRKQALAEELQFVTAGSEEETKIKREQALLDEEIQETYFKHRKEGLELLKTQIETVDKLFENLGVTLGESGANTELEKFNKQLSDPEITAAIKARAEAYGYTADELKELLKLIAESRAQAAGATRERIATIGVEGGANANAGADEEKNPSITTGLSQYFRELADDSSIKDAQGALVEFGSIGVEAIRNMTAAVGESIAAWALYGDSIGKALKKALAVELATIASKAAIKALEATALGFYNLAIHDYAGAGAAFKSAGLYAALTLGSALAAKGVAGTEFSKSAFAGSAFAQQASPNAISSGITTTQNQNRVIEIDRNPSRERQPQRQTMELNIRIPQGAVDRGIIDAINNRTEGHVALVKLIEEN